MRFWSMLRYKYHILFNEILWNKLHSKPSVRIYIPLIKFKIDIHKIYDIVNQTKIVIQSTMHENMYKYWFELNRLIKVNVKR